MGGEDVTALPTTETWEVWRKHLSGTRPDVSVRQGISEELAREILADATGDERLKDVVDFYLVRATTTRERAL